MSQIKITKSIFNICLGDARVKTQKKKAILITDSKGFSLQQQVSTEKFIDLLIISESKCSIYDTSFIWKALKSNLVKKDKATIFIWLATCDLTTKTGKYIELTHNTSRYHNKIDTIASKFSTIKAQIQARYKHSSVIILECPPSTCSIEHYNKYQGHEKASKFRSQTLLLENQIFYLNRQIKKINHEKFKVCIKIKIKKHLLKTKVDENNNTVVQANATKKSNSKTSPNFTSDILRQTNLSNRDKELCSTSIIRIYTTVCTQIPLLQSSG
jgi:hypothetical protein